jgi:hypothetical protein
MSTNLFNTFNAMQWKNLLHSIHLENQKEEAYYAAKTRKVPFERKTPNVENVIDVLCGDTNIALAPKTWPSGVTVNGVLTGAWEVETRHNLLREMEQDSRFSWVVKDHFNTRMCESKYVPSLKTEAPRLDMPAPMTHIEIVLTPAQVQKAQQQNILAMQARREAALAKAAEEVQKEVVQNV